MQKYFLITLMLPILFLIINISACGKNDEKIDPKKHEEVIIKLDEVQELQSKTDEELTKLRDDIKALEIEKQKLTAEKKRLEADIIDLKIKNYNTE